MVKPGLQNICGYKHITSIILLTVFALIFFYLLARKPNLEIFFIYSNKFFHNFHLAVSSFTCPGLQASGLAQRLILMKFVLIWLNLSYKTSEEINICFVMYESFYIFSTTDFSRNSKIFNLQYKIYRSYDYKYIGQMTGADIKAKILLLMVNLPLMLSCERSGGGGGGNMSSPLLTVTASLTPLTPFIN